MVHVIVTMRIRKGRMQDFLAACRELRPQVLREQGCLAYDYTRDVAPPRDPQQALDADRVTLIERWESMAALMAHMEAPHMKAFGPKMKDLRESMELRFSESIF